MDIQSFMIGNMPAALYGGPSEKGFIFVHGLCGCKEEGARFAEIAAPLGWQTLAVDLPGHGGRQDNTPLVPWEAGKELRAVLDYARSMWKRVGVRAISLGAYMSLTAFADEAPLDMCLLSSPLVDMERMITDMMAAANVSEARLEKEREIPAGDQTLSWDYLCWTRAHPVYAVSPRTYIFRAQGDELIPTETVERFAAENHAHLYIMPGGEHWLHTEEDVKVMSAWEKLYLCAMKVECGW